MAQLEVSRKCRESTQSVENRERELIKGCGNLALTPHQQATFAMIQDFIRGETGFQMGILEGPAGTGKTTLVGELVRYAMDRVGRIAIAAPTNKAVRVLKSRVERQTGTLIHPSGEWDQAARKPLRRPIEFASIHSLLGLRLNEREDGSQECKQENDPTISEYDLVIVDECSMLSEDLVQRIAVSKGGAFVLFVGDSAQLPPVGDSDTVSPVFAQVPYRVMLSEVVRQARDNPIIRLSIAIRKAQEGGDKISLQQLAEALPLEFPAKAGLMQGGHAAAVSAALYEIQHGRDARIIAFTNAAVLAYNRELHESLHGYTEFPFVVGERVIAHQAFEATQLDANGDPVGTAQVITSEELVILECQQRPHFIYRDKYPCARVVLQRDSGAHVVAWVARDQAAVDRDVSGLFTTWRARKSAVAAAERSRDERLVSQSQKEAKEASQGAWALRKAFAPLRHTYAITAHKSQGSTFDTAIVDLQDMHRIRSPFAFNRALYVAATRPAQHLAIVT